MIKKNNKKIMKITKFNKLKKKKKWSLITLQNLIPNKHTILSHTVLYKSVLFSFAHEHINTNTKFFQPCVRDKL